MEGFGFCIQGLGRKVIGLAQKMLGLKSWHWSTKTADSTGF